MMRSFSFASAATLSVLVLAGCATASVTPDTENSFSSAMQEQAQSSQQVRGETWTLDEVAQHTTVEDCIIAVNGNVYDITSFIPNHPGGPAKIIPLCGTDATEKFMGKHGEQQPPQDTLATFQIGIVQ